MNIPLLSMSLSQSNLQSQVSLSLMKNVMDTSQANANALTEMLSTTNAGANPPHPHLGGIIDTKA
ncbi:hypothetical protein GCM10008967_06600 [Bacillus carboniphilus]|uniref:Motility protein n=1 Tax=Bacillus carboniphilus TaxID=86663 RepID=A0ABN0VW13_9BACI